LGIDNHISLELEHFLDASLEKNQIRLVQIVLNLFFELASILGKNFNLVILF